MWCGVQCAERALCEQNVVQSDVGVVRAGTCSGVGVTLVLCIVTCVSHSAMLNGRPTILYRPGHSILVFTCKRRFSVSVGANRRIHYYARARITREISTVSSACGGAQAVEGGAKLIVRVAGHTASFVLDV